MLRGVGRSRRRSPAGVAGGGARWGLGGRDVLGAAWEAPAASAPPPPRSTCPARAPPLRVDAPPGPVAMGTHPAPGRGGRHDQLHGDRDGAGAGGRRWPEPRGPEPRGPVPLGPGPQQSLRLPLRYRRAAPAGAEPAWPRDRAGGGANPAGPARAAAEGAGWRRGSSPAPRHPACVLSPAGPGGFAGGRGGPDSPQAGRGRGPRGAGVARAVRQGPPRPPHVQRRESWAAAWPGPAWRAAAGGRRGEPRRQPAAC